ncbi:hypothetical protein, partial [Mycobacterium tuberculosis]|uniref:hypothetical protein n=1 Tax=Mycobacterium tuberculosis TaxID=1773 RepID=UPI000AB50490
ARSRSSGGYLLDEPPDMTPSFPRTGVSGHAGAVQPSLSTLSETLRVEMFTEPEGEYEENEVD